jgi:hypothetical protein
MAYTWFSVFCEDPTSLADRKDLLLLSLELGFRHLESRFNWVEANLTHTHHHQQMIDIVFKSGDSGAIVDFLHAWTSFGYFHTPHTSLNMCASNLVNLHDLDPSSLRLRQLVIRAAGNISYQAFEQAGVERFIGLLDGLHVSVEDVDGTDDRTKWITLLLETAQSSEGIQLLSHQYWELLVELALMETWWLRGTTHLPHKLVLESLEGAKEWDKLESWMALLWTIWPPEVGKTAEEDLEHIMLSLSHNQPGAFQKLEEWMERWSQMYSMDVPESFQRICKQAHLEAAQQ